MSIVHNRDQNEFDKFVESTLVSGQPGIVVVNPDGSSISGSGGTEVVVGNVASLATDSGNPVKVGSVYNVTPPAPTNGQRVDAQADSQGDIKIYQASLLYGEDTTNNVIATANKPIIASTYSRSIDTSFATAVTHNSKSTAGVLLSLTCSNINAAVRYFQIFNSTGSTATVLLSFPMPAGTSTAPYILSVTDALLGQNGLYLSTGITWGISTSAATYSAATATDHVVNLFYV